MKNQNENYKGVQQVFYCSGSSASTEGNGTLEAPFRSLADAHRVVPDGSLLLLERGYEYPFFDEFNSRSVSFGAYGYGNAPVVTRFARVRNVRRDLFTRDGSTGNVWNLSFNRLAELSGVDTDKLKNIAFVYNPYTDSIVYGRKVAFPNALEMYLGFDYKQPDQGQLQAYTCLAKDGDFYQSRDGATIKVYSSVNPNDSVYPKNFNIPVFGDDSRTTQELWFATGGSFIVHPHNCEIRDIKIVGFGRHAIEGGMSNVLIDNVQIDLVGGMTQNPNDVTTKNFIRVGNGIEVWCSIQIPSHDVTVSNCAISRVFDGAATIQGYMDEPVEYGAENISIIDNLFNECRIAYEGFCYYNKPNGEIVGGIPMKDCSFIGNKSYNAGYNGFNCPEPRDCHLYNGTPGMVIRNNYFYNGNYMFRFTDQFGFDMGAGNICHIQPGQFMLQESTDSRKYVFYPDAPTHESVAAAVAQYRAKARDNHTVFVGIDSVVSVPNGE